MLNSLRMHHAFDNLTTISLTKFHLVKKACKFITSSNEACQFLEAMMANVINSILVRVCFAYIFRRIF